MCTIPKDDLQTNAIYEFICELRIYAIYVFMRFTYCIYAIYVFMQHTKFVYKKLMFNDINYNTIITIQQ